MTTTDRAARPRVKRAASRIPAAKAGKPRAAGRAGFSLIEVLVALTVFGAVIAASLGFMSVQNKAFSNGLDEMTGLQTVRFAMEILEADLSTVGTNVPAGQPSIALAATDAIAFSSDYVTNVAKDPFAVYYDPDAPTGQVQMTTVKATLPNSGGFQYPDTAYTAGPVMSPAEMILFFFRPDSSTTRTDDYVLFRKVNTGNAELVANNLLQSGSLPFFRYFTATDQIIDSVPAAQMPLKHSIRMHGAAADTGLVSKVDSVRAVRISIKATNGKTGAQEETAELTRIVLMPNVQNRMVEACGSDPLLGQALSATVTTTPTGDPAIRLNWSPATDEAGGEQDVMRYVIWRREPPTATWDEPYLSIPAGQANYQYLDAANIQHLHTYQYGLAAQDCSPALSAITASPTRFIP